MATEVEGVRSTIRTQCVEFMLDKGLVPMESKRFIGETYWKGKQKTGLIRHTMDDEWIAVVWRSPMELEHA